MTTRVIQLRMQLRNAEALVDHLVEWIDELQDDLGAAPAEMLVRLRAAKQLQLQYRRDLALITCPAASSIPNETLAGSLVTNQDAAQPGLSS